MEQVFAKADFVRKGKGWNGKHFEDKVHAELIKSGAFEYGNGTSMVFEYENGNEECFDTRYCNVTPENFAQFAYDELRARTIETIDIYTVTDYTGKYKVGDIVTHRGHECRVTAVWNYEGKDGVSIIPTGDYGFEVDLYENQI